MDSKEPKNKLLNCKIWIIRFFSIKPNELRAFGVCFAVFAIWFFLPYLHRLVYGVNKILFLHYLYDFIKEFLSTLVTGIFFYLTYETLREKSEIKNELGYCIFAYKQMKEEILWQIILADNNGLPPANHKQITEAICFNPIEARKYFTEDRILKNIFELDDRTLRIISRSINLFLERLNPTSYRFLQSGDASLINIYNYIKDLGNLIEEYLVSEGRPILWDINRKTTDNLLYLLFIEGESKEDPKLKILSEMYKRYE